MRDLPVERFEEEVEISLHAPLHARAVVEPTSSQRLLLFFTNRTDAVDFHSARSYESHERWRCFVYLYSTTYFYGAMLV